MIELLRAGGAPGLLVLLLSAATLVTAVRMVAGTGRARMTTVKALTVATLLAVAAGIVSNVSIVLFAVTSEAPAAVGADPLMMLMRGIGEALAPGSIGLTALAVAWMVVSLHGAGRSTDESGTAPAQPATASAELQSSSVKTTLRRIEMVVVFAVGAINLVAALATVAGLFRL